MDGADYVIDMAIYDDDDRCSPYTPPPPIRTPREKEEAEQVLEVYKPTAQEICKGVLIVNCLIAFIFVLPYLIFAEYPTLYLASVAGMFWLLVCMFRKG